MGFFNIRNQILSSALASILLVMTVVVGCEGWYSLSQSMREAEEEMHRAKALGLSLDTARLAQVDFKKQVQEWKDILLRGNDPALFEKNHEAFISHGKATEADLRKLEGMLDALGLDASLAKEIILSHRSIEARYEQALKQYDPADRNSGLTVDRLIRGIDRPLTERFSAIVAEVQSQSSLLMQQTIRDAKLRYQRSSLLLLAVVVLAVALGSIVTYLLKRELLRQYAESMELNKKLTHAHQQLLQSEKLASIGQLAAGVAHEINNPIGYVSSSLGSLEGYLGKLFGLLAGYEEEIGRLAVTAESAGRLDKARQLAEIDYLREDMPDLMRECKEGIARVRGIVQDLKSFSHSADSREWQFMDLHRGIDSTLNIANNEIKYKATVIKEYGEVPQIECLPAQINQVILNLLVNAAQAIPEKGEIIVRTGCEGEDAWFEVADTGCGIPQENLSRIFDPFFTTKPVGQGTGLGLALSYDIVQKHGGHIDVRSEIGKGTAFRVTLPVKAPVGNESMASA